MGNGDRRHSRKSLQRRSQRKKLARARRVVEERAARIAAVGKPAEKKSRSARKPSSAS